MYGKTMVEFSKEIHLYTTVNSCHYGKYISTIWLFGEFIQHIILQINMMNAILLTTACHALSLGEFEVSPNWSDWKERIKKTLSYLFQWTRGGYSLARCSAKNTDNSYISYTSFISYIWYITSQSFPHENTHFWVVGFCAGCPKKYFGLSLTGCGIPKLPNQGVPKPGLHLNKTQNQWDNKGQQLV